MKKIVCFLVAVIFTNMLFAQEDTTKALSRKELRERKKEARQAELQKDYEALSVIVENRSFVLEAQFISNQRGNRFTVPSSINFILVDSTSSTIQTGNYRGMGRNGVGGATAQGTVSNWKIEKDDKHKSIWISYNINSISGFYDVSINVSANGSATASISGIQPGKLFYDGKLIPLEESAIFEGRHL